MKAAVGLNINHNLIIATNKALKQAETRLNEQPLVILYFTGSHSGGAKTYNAAMAVIKKKYPRTALAGCSGVGLANGDDHGLKGAGIILLSGISARSSLIKRFRIGTRFKTKKVLKDCTKTVNEEKQKSANTTFFFFPPGLGFPKIMANMLNHRIEGINPFFALNNPVWRKFPILSKLVGKMAGVSMDFAGIGISYSSTWSLFTELYNRGIHYTGTFGADPVTLSKAYQFYNFKAYKDSLSYISISSPTLKFESRTDSGAQPLLDKSFDIDSFLDGGFIPRIRGKWGAEGLLELYDMDKTPEVLEECTQKYFYYHPFRPLCVIDENQKQYLYALSINPNIKHALITAPNQIVKKLKAKDPDHLMAYIGDQSASTIENLLNTTLSELVTKDTVFGLFFDCGNRAMIVGDKFDKYMDVYNNHFRDIPYLVVISGGEINSQKFPMVNFSTISSIAKKTSPYL
jgi:hypothetical protein